MRFSRRRLFLLLLVVSIFFAIIAERYRPVRIAIGMSRATVEKRIKALGACDYWDYKQVYNVSVPVGEDRVEAFSESVDVELFSESVYVEEIGPILNLKERELSVEITYDNDVVELIRLWDYRGRDLPESYKGANVPELEQIEYDLVAEFRMSQIRRDFNYDTIKTINKGVFPPKKQNEEPQ
ncbi:MAG: hypothetical protein ABL888_18045 [Pirellulaceae bacterium]